MVEEAVAGWEWPQGVLSEALRGNSGGVLTELWIDYTYKYVFAKMFLVGRRYSRMKNICYHCIYSSKIGVKPTNPR